MVYTHKLKRDYTLIGWPWNLGEIKRDVWTKLSLVAFAHGGDGPPKEEALNNKNPERPSLNTGNGSLKNANREAKRCLTVAVLIVSGLAMLSWRIRNPYHERRLLGAFIQYAGFALLWSGWFLGLIVFG